MGGGEKESKLKLPLDTTGAAVVVTGIGMSVDPSREISGKADAARSKSMSSAPVAVAKEPPVSVGTENSSPSTSFSRARKSSMVFVVVVDDEALSLLGALVEEPHTVGNACQSETGRLLPGADGASTNA